MTKEGFRDDKETDTVYGHSALLTVCGLQREAGKWRCFPSGYGGGGSVKAESADHSGGAGERYFTV